MKGAFDNRKKKKHNKGRDGMKKFCKDLKGNTKKITN